MTLEEMLFWSKFNSCAGAYWDTVSVIREENCIGATLDRAKLREQRQREELDILREKIPWATLSISASPSSNSPSMTPSHDHPSDVAGMEPPSDGVNHPPVTLRQVAEIYHLALEKVIETDP